MGELGRCERYDLKPGKFPYKVKKIDHKIDAGRVSFSFLLVERKQALEGLETGFIV